MNEEAVQQLYSLAQAEGYSKSFEDFKVLMGSNEEALNNMYNVAKGEGYQKDINQFKTLVGFGDSTNVVEETEIVSTDDPEKKNPIGLDQPNLPEVPEGLESPLQSETENVSSESSITEEEVEDPFAGTLLADEIEDPFDVGLSTITNKLIDKEEEFVVPDLNYRFNDYGFTFEETGIGDAMVVQSANGEKISIDLDPMMGATETAEAAKLRNFLEKNRVESENRLAATTSRIEKKNQQIRDEKEIEATVKLFNEQTENFRQEVVEFSNAKAELDKLYEAQFAGLSASDIKGNPEKKAAYQTYINQKKDLMGAFSKLQEKEKTFSEKGALLDQEVGRYVQMQSTQGTWSGGLWNAAMKGASSFASQAVDVMTDFFVEVNPMQMG
jgi:hypothetical protein